MITCIIVDDEQHAIDILVHYTKLTPQLTLVATFTNPIEALSLFNEQKIDLVFLDIQMPELSGIDFIKSIHNKTKIILTTAYSEFALEGYDLNVLDYLLKPIRLPRFLAAVQKTVEQVHSIATLQPVTEEDYIFVKTESKGKLIKINLIEIDFIESMKNYMCIHACGAKTMVLTSMKELEERLPKHQFIRVHKSFIIPIHKISGIEGNHVKLKHVATGIQIGDTYKDELMQLIKGKTLK